MSAMPEHAGATTLPLPLPRGRPFVVSDLEAMPDDGRRYELIDGTLIVRPAPSFLHQRVAMALSYLLEDVQPNDDFEVLAAPFDAKLADDTAVEPDVRVARSADISNKWLEKAPLLAVEVLSPSSRLIDPHLKRSRLRDAGCQSYWVVDPNEPSLIAWELRDGGYIEVGHVRGDETFRARLPYPVDVTPRALVERRRA